MVRRIDVATLLRLKRRPLGQTFLLVSIALVVVLGMAALAVDVGDLWTTRRLMQSAADAGAVSGAHEGAPGGDRGRGGRRRGGWRERRRWRWGATAPP